MRFLTSVGAKAKRPPLAGDASVASATGLPPTSMGKPYTPRGRVTTNLRSLVQDSYERVTWVFRPVNAIASNQAALPIVCRRDDPANGELIDHPLLPLLNYQASPYTREQAFVFRMRVSAQLLLSTKGVFIEVHRRNNTEPDALQILPPQSTHAVPSPTTFVDHFEVILNDGSKPRILDPRDVVWLRNPHPLDPYRSMTPAEAAGLAIDTDWLAALYNAQFLRNDGRPGGIIGIKGQLDDDDAEELKSFFAGGAMTAGAWRVIESDGIDLADLATNPRDMQYVEGRDHNKVECLVAFGVPESVLGNSSKRTFDNADAEERIFWTQTMPPHNELIFGGFDMIDADPNTFIVPDTSGVQVLQQVKANWWNTIITLVRQGLLTLDEARVEIGRAPFELPETQIPYIPMGQQPLVALADSEDAPPAQDPIALGGGDSTLDDAPAAPAAALPPPSGGANRPILAAGRSPLPAKAGGARPKARRR